MTPSDNSPSGTIWSDWEEAAFELHEHVGKGKPLRCVRLLKTSTSSHCKNLVVVLHGLDFNYPLPGEKVDCDHLNSFLKMLLLDEKYNALANVLLIDYCNHLFVHSKTARDLPAAVSQAIVKAHSETECNNIIFIGHSFGSLLARRVIVDAAEPRMNTGVQNWCQHATGMISLAGTNLGFKIDKVSSLKMRMFSWAAGITGLLAPWLVDTLSSRGRLGRLAFYSWRNSPWVVDTRLKWLRLYEGTVNKTEKGDSKTTKFKTLSITGTMDALVGQDDQEMVYQLGDLCCTRSIKGVRHEGFMDPVIGKKSHAVKILDEKESEELKASLKSDIRFLLDDTINTGTGWEEVKRVSRFHAAAPVKDEGFDRIVIFLIHGIRDNAEWQEDIDYNLRKIHNDRFEDMQSHVGSTSDKDSARPPKAAILISQVRYGYFSALQFLFPSERRRAIRAFSDEYLRVLARFPDLRQENIHVYAHSNGTFILGEALRKYREIKVNRVLLGGSVLPPNFPWRKYVNCFPKSEEDSNKPDGHQVMEILNYAANRDAPTGLLCRGLGFIRLPILGQPPLLGIGPGGTDGFDDLCNYKYPGREGSVRGWNFFLDGDHGATLATGYQSPKGIAAYLLGKKPNENDSSTKASSAFSFKDLNDPKAPNHPLRGTDRGRTKSYPSMYHGFHGNLFACLALLALLGIFLLLIGFPLALTIGQYTFAFNAMLLILFSYLLSRL